MIDHHLPSEDYEGTRMSLSSYKLDPYADVSFSRLKGRTLVHGKDMMEPIDIFGLKRYHKICNVLEKDKIWQLNSLQRSAWPHIIRLRNATIIGGTNAHKGKSLSYLAPIAFSSMELYEEVRMETNRGVMGPIGLILCGTAKSCDKVKSMLIKLLCGSSYVVEIVHDYETSSKRRLRGSTEFVVTTAPCAVELFEKFFDKFQFERLRFLVFDDTQISLAHHRQSVEELIIKVNNYRSKLQDASPVQTIFCGTVWNDVIASATAKLIDDPVIIIDSCMASLVYGNIDFTLHDCEEYTDKLKTLSDILCQKELDRVIVVCGGNEAFLDEIRTKIYRDTGHTVFVGHERAENIREQLQVVTYAWTNKDRGVYLLTDGFLKETEIRDANYVIHLSLPAAGRKGAFADRHMAMWSYFPDVTKYKDLGDQALRSKEPLKSIVLLSPHEDEFSKIVQQLESIGVSIPSSLRDAAKEQNEADFAKHRVCMDFQLFGKCLMTEPCSQRHFFSREELSQTPTVPRQGRIQVEIWNVVQPNYFEARLLKYYDVESGREANNIQYLEKGKELQTTLDDLFLNTEPTSWQNLRTVRVGAFCAVEDKGHMRRGRIVIDFDGDKWRVFCIDFGDYLIRATDDIYALPSTVSLDKFPCLSVKLILAGIKPLGAEPCFTLAAKSLGLKFAKKIMTGKIVLSIGNVVWVSPLIEHGRGKQGEWLQLSNIRVELTKIKGLAEINPNHMELLYKVCEESSGTSYDAYRVFAVVGEEMDQFQSVSDPIVWAFLRKNYEGDNQASSLIAYCSYYRTLQCIFIRRTDFNKILEELNQDIHASILSRYKDTVEKYPLMFQEHYQTGLAVACSGCERGQKRWRRAIIMDKQKRDKGIEFDVYFVDIGKIVSNVTITELFPLRREFVTRLPFQTVIVRCSHVVHLATDIPNNQDGIENMDIDKLIGPYLIGNELLQELEVSITSYGGRYIVNGIKLCNMYDGFIFPRIPSFEMELGEVVVYNGIGKFVNDGEIKLSRLKHLLLQHYNKVYDSIQDESDEEYDDMYPNESDDEYDAYIGEGADAAKTARKLLLALGVAKEQVESDVKKVETMETVQPHQVSNTPASHACCSELHEAEANKSINDKPKLGLQTVPVQKKPKVEWSQTPEHIILWIHIPDLRDYKLTVDAEAQKNVLSFVSLQPADYSFELILVGKVFGEFQEVLNGQYLFIKLRKLSQRLRWPYLLDGKPSQRWLKSRIDENTEIDERYSSDEEQYVKGSQHPSEQKKLSANLSIYVDDDGSDDDLELEEMDYSSDEHESETFPDQLER